MHTAAFLPLAVLPFALATNYDVKVGVNKDNQPGLYYTPDKLTPAKGDTVRFAFTSDQHSVAQSSFDKPCEYLKDGIFSGFPGPGKTFTITVNSTDPIWLYCSHQGHCQGGQALVLNEPKDKTLDAYKTAAQGTDQAGDTDDDLTVKGGFVADADTAQTTSATGTAKTTGGSTATSGRGDASVSASASQTSASRSSAATASGTAPSATPSSTGAAGKFTAGAGLGAVGLLGFLVGGMI